MGIPIKQRPVKLIASIVFKEEDLLNKAERSLKRMFGGLESLQKSMPFDFTDYYEEEMGSGLRRKLICFKRLVSVDEAAKIKLLTNKLEAKLGQDGNRRVNIDPGYVTEAKLVLLTTKDYTHRIYIGKRMFAESTLFYKDSSFHSWQWTYPDYASSEMIHYFNNVREIYMENINPSR